MAFHPRPRGRGRDAHRARAVSNHVLLVGRDSVEPRGLPSFRLDRVSPYHRVFFSWEVAYRSAPG